MPPKFQELQCVTLRTDHGCAPAGTVGTIVHIFTRPSVAYLIEFCDDEGETTEMVTLNDESDIRPWPDEQAGQAGAKTCP